ncbi:hypothetical protein LMG24076_00667 [Trinickia soli]|nr:hypothetical protein LMG24076_00667 [Trinickia soli]
MDTGLTGKVAVLAGAARDVVTHIAKPGQSIAADGRFVVN